MREISFNGNFYRIHEKQEPHIIVESKKEIHGWFYDKKSRRRECTSERMLINPYNGCSHNCFFCYAHSMKGYFEIFRKLKIITVFKDFDKVVAEQLDSLNLCSCGYLSPVTDPFQPLNNEYKLTEKIMNEFVKRNIPVEFITKGKVSDEAINIMKKQKHSFGQISVLTLNEELRKKFSFGADTETLLKNIERLSDNGIYAVARIDPIFPYITDKKEDLTNIVQEVKERGAKHIIASCVDILSPVEKEFYEGIYKIDKKLIPKYRKLYNEKIGNYINADITYRKRLFEILKEICVSEKISFSLCMEFEKTKNSLSGLNSLYSTTLNCEGIDVPVYIRDKKENKFKPLKECKGNCLTCSKCLAVPELSEAKALTLSDYKRFGKFLDKKFQQKLNFNP